MSLETIHSYLVNSFFLFRVVLLFNIGENRWEKIEHSSAPRSAIGRWPAPGQNCKPLFPFLPTQRLPGLELVFAEFLLGDQFIPVFDYICIKN